MAKCTFPNYGNTHEKIIKRRNVLYTRFMLLETNNGIVLSNFVVIEFILLKAATAKKNCSLVLMHITCPNAVAHTQPFLYITDNDGAEEDETGTRRARRRTRPERYHCLRKQCRKRMSRELLMDFGCGTNSCKPTAFLAFSNGISLMTEWKWNDRTIHVKLKNRNKGSVSNKQLETNKNYMSGLITPK